VRSVPAVVRPQAADRTALLQDSIRPLRKLGGSAQDTELHSHALSCKRRSCTTWITVHPSISTGIQTMLFARSCESTHMPVDTRAAAPAKWRQEICRYPMCCRLGEWSPVFTRHVAVSWDC
jgi:hypothetical protein